MVDMILFDVDGVILSEERYFDASALTVWELIHSPNYLGLQPKNFTPSPDETTIRRVRKEIFDDDRVLHTIKNRGINANWDMVYLTFSCQLIRFLQSLVKEDHETVRTFLNHEIDREALQTIGKKIAKLKVEPDYPVLVSDYEGTTVKKQELLTYLNTIAEEKTGIPTAIFSRNSTLWDVCQRAFQEWYLGGEKSGTPAIQTGKRGFLTDEIPIVEPDRMKQLFQTLKDKGFTLGLGTGRPEIETVEPLTALGLIDFFDDERIVTAQDVLDTERQYPEQAPLSKPQPFTFVYGWLGKEHSAHEAIEMSLPLDDSEKLLIVGDSPADYYAAKSIGAHFAAVLTGLSGQEARAQFEQLGAEHILNDVTEVIDIV
jgi:phosphoglycolate phosphatase-like HAD superfamily hydrolase